MDYTNEKIKSLIDQREKFLSKINSEIEKEIEKERSKYKFSWRRFLIMIAIVVGIPAARIANEKIFPNTSIWSWEYYEAKLR